MRRFRPDDDHKIVRFFVGGPNSELGVLEEDYELVPTTGGTLRFWDVATWFLRVQTRNLARLFFMAILKKKMSAGLFLFFFFFRSL